MTKKHYQELKDEIENAKQANKQALEYIQKNEFSAKNLWLEINKFKLSKKPTKQVYVYMDKESYATLVKSDFYHTHKEVKNSKYGNELQFCGARIIVISMSNGCIITTEKLK